METASLNFLLWLISALPLSHCWSWELGQKPWLTVLCLGRWSHVLTTGQRFLLGLSLQFRMFDIWLRGCSLWGSLLLVFFFSSLFSGFLDSRGGYREQLFLLVIILPHLYVHVSVVAILLIVYIHPSKLFGANYFFWRHNSFVQMWSYRWKLIILQKLTTEIPKQSSV